ncbi:obscurin-like [Heteronotia binoei]|uniref:obscurin-like n=1 Tax=Heteronotia binoei TaxID=13085 RepID=UPI0029317CF8|nr:obscurin-like [Heteronotia binoei]
MKKLHFTEDNMRCLLLTKIYFLTLLFLSYLHMALGKNDSSVEQGLHVNGVNRFTPYESSTKASSTVSGTDCPKKPQPILVIQKPAAVEVIEGSTLRMECYLQINSSIWYIQWFKNGIKLTNSNRMSIITREKESRLILNKIEKTDSGIYTCKLFDHKNCLFSSNGTQLTVDEITDLMVNQTPEHINQKEGANVTIECRFRTISVTSTDVRWYRNESKLNSAGDSLRTQVDLKRGFSSLTLTNAAVSDSGNYQCQVESRSRNLIGSGKASRVAITADLPAHITKQQGTSLVIIGGGAGAGVAILLLVVAGVIMWKHRSKVSRSELETSPAKETELHPPLVSQPSEVTYADLHFNKREVRPDAEVVYAEVRAPQKQPAYQDAKQMRPAGNQRR